MSNILPTSLDMASAKILGFDAQAYIDDTKSNLAQKLNIPQNFSTQDSFVLNNTGSKSKKRTGFDFGAFTASFFTTAGFLTLATIFLKGSSRAKAFVDGFKKSFTSAGTSLKKFFGNLLSNAKNFKKTEVK